MSVGPQSLQPGQYGTCWQKGLLPIRDWLCGFQAIGHLVPKGQAESSTVMMAGLSLRIRLTLHRIKPNSP